MDDTHRDMVIIGAGVSGPACAEALAGSERLSTVDGYLVVCGWAP